MAKITRKNQKLFGSTAGTNELSKFGSFAAGVPVRYNGSTIDPDNIQALANFLEGWFGASIGNNSPCEEDENSLFYLAFYQLFYLLQTGVPEWNLATTYFIGSVVNDGNGNLYISRTDNNLNNALSDATNWRTSTTNIASKTANYTATNVDSYIRCNTTGGAFTITLTAGGYATGKMLRIKNVGAVGANVTISAADLIDGNLTLVLADMDSATLIYNGSTWDIL